MEQVRLTIRFNSEFRIGTGNAGNMVDDVLDPERLVPGASIKGVMRDAARLLFPMRGQNDHPLVVEVFGDVRTPCPWHWEDGKPVSDPVCTTRVRVALEARRKAVPGALFVSEVAAVCKAKLIIWQQRSIPAERMPLHLALLNISARLVDGLGADRRRAFGWVTISTDRDCQHDVNVLAPLREDSDDD